MTLPCLFLEQAFIRQGGDSIIETRSPRESAKEPLEEARICSLATRLDENRLQAVRDIEKDLAVPLPAFLPPGTEDSESRETNGHFVAAVTTRGHVLSVKHHATDKAFQRCQLKGSLEGSGI